MPYYESGRRSFLSMIPPATKHLLLINILLYVAVVINDEFMFRNFAVFFPTWSNFPVAGLPDPHIFKPWQLLTYMFIHANFAHLFMNMWGLMMFGMVLEREIGTKKFLILYFVSGFMALVFHFGVQYLQIIYYASAGAAQTAFDLLRTPTLGASGCIYGVQVAFAVLYPNLPLTLIFPPVTMKAKWLMLIFIGIELIAGITGTMEGVAHFAHLGGALAGCLLILWWKRRGAISNY